MIDRDKMVGLVKALEAVETVLRDRLERLHQQARQVQEIPGQVANMTAKCDAIMKLVTK